MTADFLCDIMSIGI